LREYLYTIFSGAEKSLPYLKDIELLFTPPNQSSHGDQSTNLAMLLTKKLRKNPREIASEIIKKLIIDNRIISKVFLFYHRVYIKDC
jgi:arginyl-tRNA synthetase